MKRTAIVDTVPPEVRASAERITELAEAIDWETDSSKPSEAKIRRLCDRMYVELGTIGRAYARKVDVS